MKVAYFAIQMLISSNNLSKVQVLPLRITAQIIYLSRQFQNFDFRHIVDKWIWQITNKIMINHFGVTT